VLFDADAVVGGNERGNNLIGFLASSLLVGVMLTFVKLDSLVVLF
jgi:hypothetical protein